jgi:hypothetical protein
LCAIWDFDRLEDAGSLLDQLDWRA